MNSLGMAALRTSDGGVAYFCPLFDLDFDFKSLVVGEPCPRSARNPDVLDIEKLFCLLIEEAQLRKYLRYGFHLVESRRVPQ